MACFTICTLPALAYAKKPAHPALTALSRGGMVQIGPKLVVVGGTVDAVWVEEPKTLVVAALDGSSRQEVPLAEEDAPVAQLWPVALADGKLGVALLETGVERQGVMTPVPLRRLTYRTLGEDAPVVTIAEAPDDGSGEAPAAIIGAGVYGQPGSPAVLWLRTPRDGAREGDEPRVELSVVRADGVLRSEPVGDGRGATSVAFRADGAAVVGGHDAGRPFVSAPTAESPVSVPTPAYVTSLAADATGDMAWLAAGIDGSHRLFVVGGSEGDGADRRFLLPVQPMVDAPPDLADSGTMVGAPALVGAPADGRLALLYTARETTSKGVSHDELRVRPVAADGRPLDASTSAGACPSGSHALAFDAVSAGGKLAAAILCEGDGHADVEVTQVDF